MSESANRLQLHDTLTRTAREVWPSEAGTLRFYGCGPTVYGPAHIGNFRTFIAQDVFRRVVELSGTPTLHVRNITDVDDKTIRDSQKAGQTLLEFTRYWTERFHADCAALNLLPPHVEPKATDHIAHQIKMIEDLISHATPMPRRMDQCTSASRPMRTTASFPIWRTASSRSGPPRPRMTATSTRKTRWRTSPCGRPIRQMTVKTSGKAPGARGGPAGTWSAAPWPWSTSGSSLICTAAGSTLSSPTMRTRSPRAAARPGAGSPGTGCTSPTSWWTAGR